MSYLLEKTNEFPLEKTYEITFLLEKMHEMIFLLEKMREDVIKK